MSLSNAFLQEFEREAATTRRVLERVPADRFAWKPHPRSRSLGELAMHVATVPQVICGWAVQSETPLTAHTPSPTPASSADLIAALDRSVQTMRETLGTLGDEGLKAGWKGTARGATVMEMPKVALIRTVALNHWYHHRGQLSVYLRLLDVPVPAMYGPSADEP
jgi:uncharacterized damage-inducible protein DinB